MKGKYEKYTGEILRSVEISIIKTTKKVEYEYKEYPVLLSTDDEFVVAGAYRFEVFNRNKKREYSGHRTVGAVTCHEQKWGLSSYPDRLIAKSISFHSKAINDKKAMKALSAFIEKEAWFYHGLIGQISAELRQLMKSAKP